MIETVSTDEKTDAVRSSNGPDAIDFAEAPFTVIWEVTRACDLRCVHCRADASSLPDFRELSPREGLDLLGQIEDLGSPVFVITGGDPLKRPDLFDLIADATRRGLSVAITPSGTPLLGASAIQRMAALGVKRIALSLDAPDAEAHDAFRRQLGSYAWTVAGIRHARECGVPVQINTTVTRRNLALLPRMAELLEELGAAMWSVFFLVTVGRAQADDQLEAEEYEGVFRFLYDLSRCAPFAVRTTAAPHYRRFVMQQLVDDKRAGLRRDVVPRVAGLTGDLPRALRGVTDGNGLAFVSHTGEVYPSGFLPLSAGNVRRTPLADIYRNSPLFRALRDPALLQGKCGACEYRRICSGSRARAYAMHGDPFAEEPCCAYHPVH